MSTSHAIQPLVSGMKNVALTSPQDNEAVNAAVPPGNEFYEVRAIPGKGYGCFALKPLPRGTRILADDPLLIVPIAQYLESDIQRAFDGLTQEQQELYNSLHSGHGQDPKSWPSQIHPTVRGKERQRIEEQHKARISKTASLISIFQTNCMELGGGAAVFLRAARFNHSCVPNASFTWNAAIGKETIHTMNPVAKGEEITLSYCDMTHDKSLRAWELKHYGFDCDCPACGDENESFASKSAERRFQLQELDKETRHLRGSHLAEGAKRKDFITKLLRMAVLHQEEGDYSARVAKIFLDIALVCELSNDFTSAKAVAMKAVKIKEECQGIDHPEFAKYEEVVRRLQSRVA